MKIIHRDTSTTMPLDTMLEMIFPTQTKYRSITRAIFDLFIEKSRIVRGRSELEVLSVVKRLEKKGHNRHTIYKVMREYLVPMGIINWKKFEGSIQLSNKFGNSLRRLSISWKHLINEIEKGNK